MSGPAPSGQSATDRRGLRVLSFDDCLERLARVPVGRLAFVSAGQPVILPVNHALDGASVVFRTQVGSKMEAATGASSVAYEVDAFDETAETGWSVVVRGTAELVYDEADTSRYEGLGLRSWADEEGRGQWVRVRPSEVTGRQLAR
jgi:uncharacterized protein